MTNNSDACTVLIVGGGPVGMCAAIGLRRFGVDCTLVERHASTLDFPKGRGVSVRSMEIFREWGLEQELVDVGLPRDESILAFTGASLLAPEFTRVGLPATAAPPSPTDRLICDQIAMEAVLRRHALEVGVELRFGTRMTALAEDAAGVTVELSDDDGVTSALRADWVVGADGARSLVRERLGITRSGPGSVSHAVSVLFAADVGARMMGRTAAIYRIGDLPGGALLAVDNSRRWLLIYAYDPAVDSAATLTDERCVDMARTAIGDASVAVQILGTRFWESLALTCDEYRSGRVFLAGDAAHVVTPIGGLGMNCGVADAHNLAWKLAGVIQGWAHASLLDSYGPERRPVALATAEASLGPARPPAPTMGIDLGYSYDSAVVLPDGTEPPHVHDPVGEYESSGRPGGRAPHVWLDTSCTRSTLDEFGTGFVVITDPAGAASAEAAIARSTATGIPVRQLVPPDEAWREVYGVAAGGGVIVRPDGHIAWRSRGRLESSGEHVGAALLAAVARLG